MDAAGIPHRPTTLAWVGWGVLICLAVAAADAMLWVLGSLLSTGAQAAPQQVWRIFPGVGMLRFMCLAVMMLVVVLGHRLLPTGGISRWLALAALVLVATAAGWIVFVQSFCDIGRWLGFELRYSRYCGSAGFPQRQVPESVYAETKAMTERVLAWYGTTHGLRSVSLRYFNAAGASADAAIGEDWTHSQNLVPLVMKAALGRMGRLAVFGNDYPTPDGTCIRDYIHVDDLAAAHLRSLDHLAAGGGTEAVNVGTGVGSSVLEVIAASERISGLTVPYDIVARRAGDPVSTYADPARAREVLKWQASQGLDEIIASAWAWHSTHPDGFTTS